jgi:hypothetical protein
MARKSKNTLSEQQQYERDLKACLRMAEQIEVELLSRLAATAEGFDPEPLEVEQEAAEVAAG